jgi:geranylgeranyl pyrophosphate synthase
VSDSTGEGDVPLDILVERVLGKEDTEHFVELFPPLAKDLENVEAQIREVLHSPYSYLSEAASYATASGGKRMRPLIILVAYRALGNTDTSAVYPLAAAFQLIHTASLVHDDVIDHAALRRGKPSVHQAFGLPTAIVTGDYLFVRAFQLAGRYSPEIIQRCGEASADLSQGESMQENSRFDLTLDKDRYLRIVMLKTANAFAAGAEAAGLVARAPKAVVSGLAEFGRAMGIAFQIKDDILDAYGDRDVTGKPPFSDFREGLPTLPSILAYERLSGKARVEFERLFTIRHKRPAHLLRLKELCDASGARTVANEEAERWVSTAAHSLERVPAGPYRDLMERLAAGAVQRRY